MGARTRLWGAIFFGLAQPKKGFRVRSGICTSRNICIIEGYPRRYLSLALAVCRLAISTRRLQKQEDGSFTEKVSKSSYSSTSIP